MHGPQERLLGENVVQRLPHPGAVGASGGCRGVRCGSCQGTRDEPVAGGGGGAGTGRGPASPSHSLHHPMGLVVLGRPSHTRVSPWKLAEAPLGGGRHGLSKEPTWVREDSGGRA